MAFAFAASPSISPREYTRAIQVLGDIPQVKGSWVLSVVT